MEVSKTTNLINRLDSFFGLFKHSKLVKKNEEVILFLDEFLRVISSIAFPGRQPAVHKDSKHYALRSFKKPQKEVFYYGNQTQSQKTEKYDRFPQLTGWLENFAKEKRENWGG